MAYLDSTVWLDLQASNAISEARFAPLGVVNAWADSSPMVDWITPSQKKTMSTMSSLIDMQFPTILDDTPVVNTTAGFDWIPDNLPTTAQYAYTAVDIFSGFRFHPSHYANNAVDAEFMRNERMLKVAYAMALKKEELLLSVLETNKTQKLAHTAPLNIGAGTFTFSEVSDTLTVSKDAQVGTMYYKLSNLMASNELGGEYQIVTSRGGMTEQIAQQLLNGQNQAVNKNALGMFPLGNMYETSSISAGSDVFSGFLIRKGDVGLVSNFPYDFANGTEINGMKWSISDTELPFLRSRCNIYVNNEATNSSAMVGGDSNAIMSTFEEMAIWDRFYAVVRQNSTLSTKPNGIVKIVGATT